MILTLDRYLLVTKITVHLYRPAQHHFAHWEVGFDAHTRLPRLRLGQKLSSEVDADIHSLLYPSREGQHRTFSFT